MATQEKTWNVANRLHSLKDSDNPEVNHIIAGADEIYDDAKGAKQSDINAQADAALADRYRKSETYSKEQVDALITTPDVNYVTVATFADLPQTGEANTIYRVSFYDGTQVDASKYALYAWNGATYQLLAVRSAVGEVFDVSEYNGDATYETLTAALGISGQNVPVNARRGGMTIKFINSTTGKYDQYRYIDTDATTNSKFVNTANWQGIDSELTPGSENLVESGGVERVVTDIREMTFNSDKKDWKYEKDNVTVTDNITPGIFLSYLGKTECTFTVTFGVIGNKFRIRATNKATGNAIDLYSNSDGSDVSPVVFSNPRPDLELEDVRVVLYVDGEPDVFGFVAEKTSPLANVIDGLASTDEMVKANSDNIEIVKKEDALLHGDLSFSANNTISGYFRVDILGGKKYIIKSTTDATRTLSFRALDDTAVGSSFNVPANGTITVVAEGDASYIKAGAAFTGIIGYADNVHALGEAVTSNSEGILINEGKISQLEKEDRLAGDAVNVSISSNTDYFRVDLIAGRQYVLKSFMQATATISFLSLDKETVIKKIYPTANSSNTVILDSNAYWIKAGGVFNGSISYKDTISGIAEEVRCLNEETSLFHDGIKISIPNGNTYVRVDIKAGKKYSLKTTSGADRTVSFYPIDYEGQEPVQSVDAKAGKTVDFEATSDAYWVKASNSITFYLTYAETNLNVLDKRVDSIENDTILSHEYQFNEDTQDWIFQSSVYARAGYGKHIFLSYLGRTACEITIDGTIQSNKFRVTAKDKATNQTVYLYGNASWDQVPVSELPVTFNVSKHTNELVDIGIELSSQGSSDTFEITIKKDSPIAELGSTDRHLQARLNMPSYQFGLFINGRYDVDDIDVLKDAALGRLARFYRLYDLLADAFPEFITKIDCDEECESAGIVRPDYMSDYPIYMYKIVTPDGYATPGSEPAFDESKRGKLKLFITTGTHPEYMGIWDCANTIALIFGKKFVWNANTSQYDLVNVTNGGWQNDENLASLLWDVEIYVMPCSGAYIVQSGQRTNYNGVDLNRNCPTSDWVSGTSGTNAYGGPEPASEYETKVFLHYIDLIEPCVYIDHHNSFSGDYVFWVSTKLTAMANASNACLKDMSRRWSKKYSSIFPADTVFGYVKETNDRGTRAGYAAEKGIFSTTIETNVKCNYDENGEFNDSFVSTISTDAFLNYLLRVLKTYSEIH